MKPSTLRYLLIFPVSMIVSGSLWASSYSTNFTAQTEFEYNSNPNMTDTNTGALRMQRITPGFSVTSVDGMNESVFSVMANMQHSSDENLRSSRNNIGLGQAWTRRYEHGSYGVNLGYKESSTRETELLEKGFSLNQDNKIKKYSLGANWSYAWSKDTSVAVNFGYNEKVFQTNANQNNQDTYLGTSLSHSTGERTSLSVNLSASQSRYQYYSSWLTSNSYSASLGLSYKLSALWGLGFNAGTTATDGYSNSTSWNGGANLSYSGEHLSSAVNYGRSTSVSAFGGFIETDQVGGTFSYKFDDQSSAGWNVSWSQQTASQAASVYNSTLWARQKLGKDLALRLSYQSNRTNSPSLDASGNVWLLSLNYGM